MPPACGLAVAIVFVCSAVPAIAQVADATQSAPAAPTRRMPDAPLDSPPFPSSDWSYGGSPTIGVPDGNSYPLMKALGHTTGGTKFYGWINAGVNGSTSTTTNLPEAYDIYPNRIELDQLVAIAERLPDAVQTQHFDWGFRLTAFYGIDYRFTFAKDISQTSCWSTTGNTASTRRRSIWICIFRMSRRG